MLPKRTLNVAPMLVLLAATVAFGLVRIAPVAGQDDAAKIESAMSAAPLSIAETATVLDRGRDDAGNLVVLREGSNGWFCLPDDPDSPGNDPVCYDQTWLDWSNALAANEEPNVTVLGLAYMLQGGSDASNTDPFASEPAAGEDWVSSPAHVMILVPGEIDLADYSTDHASGEPYVMWAGTPYEHIMMPVADHEHEP